MKPPVVHQPVEPPQPSDADAAAAAADADQHPRAPTSTGLVGSYGPLVNGPGAEDHGSAEQRKAP